MAGTLNTQASEFPGDSPIEDSGAVDASEWRDLDESAMAADHPTTDFSAVPNESLSKPTEGRADKVSGRRYYANGPETIGVDEVSEVGARRYASFSVTAFPDAGGSYAGTSVLLLGEDRRRVRIVMSNAHATNVVNIGTLSDIQGGGGLALPPGQLFESTVTDVIYACVPVGGTEPVTVGIWAEYM